MVFTVPAQTHQLSISALQTYHYITNWLECHKSGGEILPDGVDDYTKDMALSLVLSYLAPISVQCITGARHATPCASATTQPVEVQHQGVLAITLTALMTLAKPITAQNGPAYTKRWKAALASAKVQDLVATSSWPSILVIAGKFSEIVTGRDDLRREVVDRLLGLTKTGAEAAVLAQVKMVWEYSSLKAVQYMDQFIKSHCRALEIPAVLDQALDLKTKWAAAGQADPQLAYSRVRDVNAHQELHHSHFPDLYYAAIAHARALRIIGENFQVSQTHVSHHTVLIDKYVKKTAAVELGELSEETKKKLHELGYPITRRRAREESGSKDHVKVICWDVK